MTRDRLKPDAASRSVVDVDPELVVDAAKRTGLGAQARRARPKSFLLRPPRAWRLLIGDAGVSAVLNPLSHVDATM